MPELVWPGKYRGTAIALVPDLGLDFARSASKIQTTHSEGLEPSTLGLEDGSALSVLGCSVLSGLCFPARGLLPLENTCSLFISSLPNALLVFTAWDGCDGPKNHEVEAEAGRSGLGLLSQRGR